MTQKHIVELQIQIDQIEEYIQTEMCQKCEEMRVSLIHLKQSLKKFLEEAIDQD